MKKIHIEDGRMLYDEDGVLIGIIAPYPVDGSETNLVAKRFVDLWNGQEAFGEVRQ